MVGDIRERERASALASEKSLGVNLGSSKSTIMNDSRCRVFFFLTRRSFSSKSFCDGLNKKVYMVWIKTHRGDLINSHHIVAVWHEGNGGTCSIVAQVAEREYVLHETTTVCNGLSHIEYEERLKESYLESLKIMAEIGKEWDAIDIRLDKNKNLD